MLFTLLGIVMDVRLLQPKNAPLPMLVTLLGSVMEVRPLQPLKALDLITTIVGGNETVYNLLFVEYPPTP